MPILKAILANIDKRVYIRQARNAVEESLKEWSKLIVKDFQAFVKDWKTKPEFDEIWTVNKNVISWEYSSNNKILGFVSHGTKIRYATMTPNFIAKTVVSGRIPSRKGAGGLAFVNKSRPKPGIKARKIDFRIKRKNKNKLTRMIKARMIDFGREN